MSTSDSAAITELAALGCRFVCWRWETRGTSRTKPPLSVAGDYARTTDPTTWASLHAVESAAARLGADGIGFVLDAGRDGIVGIDLDGCRDPGTGSITEWALRIIHDISSYSEISPSGTGVKILARAEPVPQLRGNKRVIAPANGVKVQAVEVYTSGRYFCLTGARLDGMPDEIVEATEALERLAAWIAEKGTSELPEPFLTLLKRDGKLRAAWEDGAKLGRGNDTSASGLDLSLTLYLARHLNDDDLRTVLSLYRHGQIGGGKLTGTAAQRRLDQLLGFARETRHSPSPHDASEELDGFAPTEDGIALAFVERYGDRIRYDHHHGAWFLWTGQHWRKDERHLAFAWARALCREINVAGKATLARAATAAGVEKFAQRDPAVSVTSETWDLDPFLLGTPDGTVDLRTGELRAADAADMITKTTAVTPAPKGTPHPRWAAFLKEATGGDEAVIRFLQQMAGYCLTGDTREHALFFIHGSGGNGKGVFINTIKAVMGEYQRTASMETFVAAYGDRHPTDLAMLAGARLVTASETEEGRAWAESRIKQLTGGDPISARFMRRDFFTYQPSFKLVIVGNHMPVLHAVDDAARRRFNIIGFPHKPVVPDHQLTEKLKKEWPAILRWAIEGCLDWQRNGLVRPDAVKTETRKYFDNQDVIGQWIEQNCRSNPNNDHVWELSSKLRENYAKFCENCGEKPLSQRSFGPELERRGYQRKHGMQGAKIVGLMLKDPPAHHSG